MEMELQVFGTRDATIAGIVVNIEGTQYAADGTAKREPHDEDDAEIAALLAIGRALENLSNKILKRANGMVKHNDDMKKYKQVQKSKTLVAKKASSKPYGGKSKTVAKVALKK